MEKRPIWGISAAALRCMAMALMLLDHLWRTQITGNDWMNWLGRLAFPIFAFQIAEGYRHTSDFRRYALRLLFWALVSEVPFDLMISGSVFYPFHQNVLFTLLLGLLALGQIDRLPDARAALFLCLILLAALLGLPDYGALGVLTVVIFHLFRDSRLWQFCALALIHGLGYRGQTVPLAGFDFPVQAFAIFAMIPICLYNGKKGPGGKAFQLAAYAFYPVHMLILALI